MFWFLQNIRTYVQAFFVAEWEKPSFLCLSQGQTGGIQTQNIIEIKKKI